jgi:hypothetical protein
MSISGISGVMPTLIQQSLTPTQFARASTLPPSVLAPPASAVHHHHGGGAPPAQGVTAGQAAPPAGINTVA